MIDGNWLHASALIISTMNEWAKKKEKNRIE